MTAINVNGLKFSFPPNWKTVKIDDWSFYRKQFMPIRDKIKAVDLIAIAPDGTTWFIEAKDYRRHSREDSIDLGAVIVDKLFNTLAAILPAKVNANDPTEREFAREILRATRLKVVFHLEQPARPSRLHPRAFNPADIQQKLRKRLKAIDAHPLVVEKAEMRSLAWSVQ